MRKLVSIILAAVFGLGAGLGSPNLWLRVRPTPYCTVATNADWYHGSFVRVKARVFFGAGGMSVYEDCDPVEALAAWVEFTDENPSRGVYLSALMLSGETSTVKFADAIIEGKFNGYHSRGCYGPKYHIAARKIELISDVRDYVPPEANGPALRLKH